MIYIGVCENRIMTSILIIFIGTFWEVSMDIIGMKHNYDQSRWKLLADYFDKKNIKILGNQFWDNSIAWSNKWKNKRPEEGEAFIGSSTIFVTIVDGWHLTKFIWLMHVLIATILFERITDYLIVDLIILYAVFGIGHELFGYLLKFKQQPTTNKLL
jgi:hypothetical protein